MAQIILLNGCGSSGKTTIAKALQNLSDELWLHLGVDTFIDMMPNRYLPAGDKAVDGLNFIAGHGSYGAIQEIAVGFLGKRVFNAMPKVARALADMQINQIIDEVMLFSNEMEAYKAELKKHEIYKIGVFCDLKTMQERELLRGDRALGLVNGQIDLVHKGVKYDMEVDTTNKEAVEIAHEILSLVRMDKKAKGVGNSE